MFSFVKWPDKYTENIMKNTKSKFVRLFPHSIPFAVDSNEYERETSKISFGHSKCDFLKLDSLIGGCFLLSFDSKCYLCIRLGIIKISHHFAYVNS